MYSITRITAATVLLIGAALAVMGTVATPVTDASGSCDVEGHEKPLNAIEAGFLRELNDYRRAKGLSTLEESPSLRKAAMWKSVARANGASEAHEDPDRSMAERLNACGYDFIANKGENLAKFEFEGLGDI